MFMMTGGWWFIEDILRKQKNLSKIMELLYLVNKPGVARFVPKTAFNRGRNKLTQR